MWLTFFLLAFVVAAIIASAFAGGIFTIVLIPLAAIAAVTAVGMAMYNRAQEASAGQTERPTADPTPHTSPNALPRTRGGADASGRRRTSLSTPGASSSSANRPFADRGGRGHVSPPGRPVSAETTPRSNERSPHMGGITDKITGKAKEAIGDLTDDPSLHREGRQEERKGEAKEELTREQERADDKAAEVADLERKTS